MILRLQNRHAAFAEPFTSDYTDFHELDDPSDVILLSLDGPPTWKTIYLERTVNTELPWSIGTSPFALHRLGCSAGRPEGVIVVAFLGFLAQFQ